MAFKSFRRKLLWKNKIFIFSAIYKYEILFVLKRKNLLVGNLVKGCPFSIYEQFAETFDYRALNVYNSVLFFGHCVFFNSKLIYRRFYGTRVIIFDLEKRRETRTKRPIL